MPKPGVKQGINSRGNDRGGALLGLGVGRPEASGCASENIDVLPGDPVVCPRVPAWSPRVPAWSPLCFLCDLQAHHLSDWPGLVGQCRLVPRQGEVGPVERQLSVEAVVCRGMSLGIPFYPHFLDCKCSWQ